MRTHLAYALDCLVLLAVFLWLCLFTPFVPQAPEDLQ